MSNQGVRDCNERHGEKNVKKVISCFVIISLIVYLYILYIVLFAGDDRSMVVMSESMLDNFNYWNSINLIPFKTIAEYVTAIFDGTVRGHAIRNLCGNLLLLFPAGFYLPFFIRKMNKIGTYCVIMAAVIVIIEIVQMATKSGSLDIDDFILNFAGAWIGFVIFTQTPIRVLLKYRIVGE